MSYIVDELNSLIIDLSNNKIQNEETDIIYYNIITQYNNFLTDISFSDTVDELIAPLTSPYNSINSKKNIIQDKQLNINTYYSKVYDKKIKIIKEIIIICCLGLIGCFLLNKQVIGEKTFSMCLGLIFAIGFILVFYDLWDLYIRDDKNFDEYDYNVYYNKSDLSNNIVSGSLHPLIFDSQTDC
jgi:uncharacterized membrane protein (DUF485 family)